MDYLRGVIATLLALAMVYSFLVYTDKIHLYGGSRLLCIDLK